MRQNGSFRAGPANSAKTATTLAFSINFARCSGYWMWSQRGQRLHDLARCHGLFNKFMEDHDGACSSYRRASGEASAS